MRSTADSPARPDADRRRLLGALGALCAPAASPAADGAVPATTATALEAELQRLAGRAAAGCSVVAHETEGPFPLRAALAGSALLRSDMTEGRPGVPLTLRVVVTDASRRCAPLAGAWVYLWHCDKDGAYSGDEQAGAGAAQPSTFMRAVQRCDADGAVTFRTVYPGWYEGRITHIHCMVFLPGSALSARSASVATTQFAFPPPVTDAVYASPLYGKGPNTSVRSFAEDMVFADGTGTEMLALSGSVAAGYLAGITLAVDPAAPPRAELLGEPGGPGRGPRPPDGALPPLPPGLGLRPLPGVPGPRSRRPG